MAKNKKKNIINNADKVPEENQAYTRDDAYQSLEMINGWISNIDAKVSFALALAGVLIGFVFQTGFPRALQRISEVSKLKELSGSDMIGAILVCLLYLMSFFAVISLGMTIIAKIKNSNNNSSVFFFGSIGKMTLQHYKDKVNQMTEKDILEDLKEQIHTNSQICSQKAKWYNRGMRFLMVTIVLWFVCMVFRLI